MIMSINLTQNTYNCFIEEQECFLRNRKAFLMTWRRISSLTFIPPIRRTLLPFSAGKYAGTFPGGEQELYMEVQAKGIDRGISLDFRPVDLWWIILWVDLLAIELVKLLDAQRAEKARQEQLLRDALTAARAANEAKSVSFPV